MLKILNRDYKQSMGYAMVEFPNSKIVMKVDNMNDDCGYVLAVSTDPSSYDAYCEYLESLPDNYYLFLGGCYNEGVPLLVQYTSC